MSINHLLAQSVSATVAPLPLLDLQCDTISVNQVIEDVNVASGATPLSVAFPIAQLTFTGLADTKEGDAIALTWTNAAITASSVIRCTLVKQTVAATSAFAVFGCVAGSGSAVITIISASGAATTGAAGVVVLLLEIIA